MLLEINYALDVFEGHSTLAGRSIAVIQLGVGGTGSQLAPFLSRSLSQYKNISEGGMSQKHKYLLVDKDTVEEKNVIRQNFTSKDLGKNKAARMAAKLSSTFGYAVDYLDKYIEDERELLTLITSYIGGGNCVPIIINCTDTHAVRKMIHNVVRMWDSSKYNAPLYYIDSGNEEYAGQVVLGAQDSGYKDQIMLYRDTVPPDRELNAFDAPAGRFPLPTVVELYPDILESKEKFTSQLSCAERAISNPQAADTNLMAAVIIKNMVSNLMSPGGINYHHVTFNTKTGNMHTHYINKDALILGGANMDHSPRLVRRAGRNYIAPGTPADDAAIATTINVGADAANHAHPTTAMVDGVNNLIGIQVQV